MRPERRLPGPDHAGDKQPCPRLSLILRCHMGWQNRAKSQGVWGTASPKFNQAFFRWGDCVPLWQVMREWLRRPRGWRFWCANYAAHTLTRDHGGATGRAWSRPRRYHPAVSPNPPRGGLMRSPFLCGAIDHSRWAKPVRRAGSFTP